MKNSVEQIKREIENTLLVIERTKDKLIKEGLSCTHKRYYLRIRQEMILIKKQHHGDSVLYRKYLISLLDRVNKEKLFLLKK